VVKTPGRTQRVDTLRRLNVPQRTAVEVDEAGAPLSVRHRDRQVAVAQICERYRTDDRWWTAEPVSRSYFRLLLEGDRSVTVFHDRITGHWYEQR